MLATDLLKLIEEIPDFDCYRTETGGWAVWRKEGDRREKFAGPDLLPLIQQAHAFRFLPLIPRPPSPFRASDWQPCKISEGCWLARHVQRSGEEIYAGLKTRRAVCELLERLEANYIVAREEWDRVHGPVFSSGNFCFQD